MNFSKFSIGRFCAPKKVFGSSVLVFLRVFIDCLKMYSAAISLNRTPISLVFFGIEILICFVQTPVREISLIRPFLISKIKSKNPSGRIS